MTIDRYVYMLTTIPKRVPSLAKTLSTLNTEHVEAIVLNYPKICQKTNEAYPPIPQSLLDQFPKLIINHCDKDYGSMTKLLPGIPFLKQRYPNQNVGIILCDDDMLYHPSLAADFMHYHKKNPNEVLCFSGHVVANSPYYYWNLKLYNSRRLWIGKTHGVDIVHGFEGVLHQTRFLDYDLLSNTSKFPDYIRRIDDEWISFCLARQNIPRRICKHRKSKPAKDLELADPLNKHCNTINVFYQAQFIRLMVEQQAIKNHGHDGLLDRSFQSLPFLAGAGLLMYLGHLV
jgi:hypothetical protein